MNERNEIKNCGITHTSQINREDIRFQNLKAISIAKNYNFSASRLNWPTNTFLKQANKQNTLEDVQSYAKVMPTLKSRLFLKSFLNQRVLLHLILLFIHLTSRLHVIHSLWKTFSLFLWLYSSYLPEQSGIKLLIQGSLNTAFIIDLCNV